MKPKPVATEVVDAGGAVDPKLNPTGLGCAGAAEFPNENPSLPSVGTKM